MLRKSLLLSLFVTAATFLASAQDEAVPFEKELEKLTADEVLKLVRYSYTVTDQEFDARLRKDFQLIPFKLSLRPNYLRFRFEDPPQAVHLDTSEEKLVLREVVKGSNEPVPPERYGELIRNTDITYEDLALRFLYWPNPQILEQTKVKTRPAWKLRLMNPDERGPYGYVDVWIDKASGGLIKLEGYAHGPNPRMIKDFEVSHGRKIKDVWIADILRVRSFTEGKKEGTTWLEILDIK